MRVCNIRRFPDCESFTRPITTNPGSLKSGVHVLTRWTCFIACRLDCTRSPGCCGFCGVFRLGRIFPRFFFRFFFYFFERTLPAASMRPPCLVCLSTSNEARLRERTYRGRFLPVGKKASSYRGAYRVPLFN